MAVAQQGGNAEHEILWSRRAGRDEPGPASERRGIVRGQSLLGIHELGALGLALDLEGFGIAVEADGQRLEIVTLLGERRKELSAQRDLDRGRRAEP